MEDKTLVLNPEFQRRRVWAPDARSFLIDTVLRQWPIPNVYIRTKTNVETRRSYREVVDGQQRLAAIRDFSVDGFDLGKTSKELAGKTYSTLDQELREHFLTYSIGVVQLFNASDTDVLDVFHRINAYGLTLNSQERRHGKYQTGAFRNLVINMSREWSVLWDRFNIVSTRERVRMGDDQLMAQMIGVLLEGVVDGGQPSINRLYEKYDADIPANTELNINSVLDYMVKQFSETLGTSLSRSPHFLMLFAAFCHALIGIPDGGVDDDMPAKETEALSDADIAKDNLAVLADVIDMSEEEVPERFFAFKYASGGSTQRIRGRRIRFPMMYKALLPRSI